MQGGEKRFNREPDKLKQKRDLSWRHN